MCNHNYGRNNLLNIFKYILAVSTSKAAVGSSNMMSCGRAKRPRRIQIFVFLLLKNSYKFQLDHHRVLTYAFQNMR